MHFHLSFNPAAVNSLFLLLRVWAVTVGSWQCGLKEMRLNKEKNLIFNNDLVACGFMEGTLMLHSVTSTSSGITLS